MSKINLTNQELINLSQELSEILQEKLSVNLKFSCLTILQSLESKLEIVNKLRQELLKEFGERIEGTDQVKVNSIEGVNKINELAFLESEFEYDPNLISSILNTEVKSIPLVLFKLSNHGNLS